MKLKINFEIYHTSFDDFSKLNFGINPIKINYNRKNQEDTINFYAKENGLKHNEHHLFSTFTQNEGKFYFELDIDFYKEEQENKLLEIDYFINDIIFALMDDLIRLLNDKTSFVDIDVIIDFNCLGATFYNQYRYHNEDQELILLDGFGRVENKLIKYEEFLKGNKKCK